MFLPRLKSEQGKEESKYTDIQLSVLSKDQGIGWQQTVTRGTKKHSCMTDSPIVLNAELLMGTLSFMAHGWSVQEGKKELWCWALIVTLTLVLFLSHHISRE